MSTVCPKMASSFHLVKEYVYIFVDRTDFVQNLLSYWRNLLSKKQNSLVCFFTPLETTYSIKNVMSKSTGYPTCTQIGELIVRFHCLWVGFKVTSKAIGSLYSVGSLYSRRLELSLNYVINLNFCPTNPARRMPSSSRSQFVTRPLGLRMLPHLESSGLDLDVIDDTSIVDIAPWILCVPTVRLDLV